ncbi:MAG: erythromycin esterase family protein [Allosphingosinicella sp.]
MILFAALALALAAASAPAAADEARAWEPALRAAERDLCGKQVALLGENGFHGDGKTPVFKTELIKRLVTRCGYRAVFFEAGHYDFLAVQRAVRRREPVTEDMVSSAIGAIWNRDREVAPLVAFLTQQARTGRLTLGGLDDQLGALGAFYSLKAMPAELARFLPPGQREACEAALGQRMRFEYSDASPHDPASIARVQDCVGRMRGAVLASRADAAGREEYLEMLASIERALRRDFVDMPIRIAGRDRSMYLNFRWLAARLKPGAKIIVWAENVHIAKDPALIAEFSAGSNLGAPLHREYGRRAFALGFSAASGAFHWTPRAPKAILPASPDSLEGVLTGRGSDEAVYAGPAALAALGVRPSTLFDHRATVTARWAGIYDGVVVFRTERPPVRTDD